MKKLINYLADLPHRFIVAKGINGDQYDLTDNYWGENFVAQTAVLKVVDLAIIHGGNNSLCESFNFGKPMIVMPIFADQLDNAQRVHDLGFGIRLNPFTCSKQLFDAIEKLINDQELSQKMKSISKRCESNSKSNEIVIKIKHLVLSSSKN